MTVRDNASTSEWQVWEYTAVVYICTSSEFRFTHSQSESLEVQILARSRSLSFEGDFHSLQALSVASGLLCNFVAVYLMTFVQFNLQLKLCLHTIVLLSLGEFINFSQVIHKYTVIMSHNKS